MTTDNVLAFTRPAPSRPKSGKPGAPKRVRRRRQAHFSAAHPLAQIARRRCRELGHRADPSREVGPVACEQCWEAAIRADERFVVEYDLDDAAPVPADDLDEIALELAMRGKRVALTRPERAAAIDRLHEDGLSACAIGKRLHIAQRDVEAAIESIEAARAQDDAADAEHAEASSAALAA